MYLLVQCEPLLVEMAGVVPDMILRKPHAHKKECRPENHPGFETHGESHTKSSVLGNQWPTKWNLVQQKIKTKQKHPTFTRGGI